MIIHHHHHHHPPSPFIHHHPPSSFITIITIIHVYHLFVYHFFHHVHSIHLFICNGYLNWAMEGKQWYILEMDNYHVKCAGHITCKKCLNLAQRLILVYCPYTKSIWSFKLENIKGSTLLIKNNYVWIYKLLLYVIIVFPNATNTIFAISRY